MSLRRCRHGLARRWCFLGFIGFVVEVKYLTWTNDGLLPQVVYEGIREDKPAQEVVRRKPLS